VEVIQTNPSAKTGQKEPDGTVMDAMTEFVVGSTLERVPAGDVASQILLAPAAIQPSEFAALMGMVA
jgi:hypothetical protein